MEFEMFTDHMCLGLVVQAQYLLMFTVCIAEP